MVTKHTDSNTSILQHLNTFLSCDWGTSSFRLTWVSLPALEVLDGVRHGNGVAATFQAWKNSGGDEAGRMDFFLNVIRDAVAAMETRLGKSLAGIPVVISGMASSSIGMVSLPYGTLPFATDGANLTTRTINATNTFPHNVLIISGIRAADDVMRGEETQLIGSVHARAPAGMAHTYLFPGTHSKHIHVVDGEAVSFRTYMTGEFFELLSTKSILADSMRQGDEPRSEDDLSYFLEGVAEGSRGCLLNNAFHIRTKALFGQHTPRMNYYFLSGLLIGAELGDLSKDPEAGITITGSDSIVPYYEHALRSMGVTRIHIVGGEGAVLKGQAKILERTHLIS